MNCPSCNTFNPESARFCTNCGTALSMACRNCGMQLSVGAKFCHNCGTPVAPTTTTSGTPAPETQPQIDPALARLQQYIPKELLNKLENARATHSMEGERRIVTVLFCDIKGST